MRRVFGTAPLSVALALLGAGGCGSDYGDAPAGSIHQASLSLSLGPPPSELIVMVVDDQASARELRQMVALQVASFATRTLDQTPACVRPDPAREKPIDRSVVVVHPSATGDARYVSAADDPALRWREKNATLAGSAAWVSAIEAALGVEAAGGTYAPLSALRGILDLIGGVHSPATAGESALLASLPTQHDGERVLLLSANEDESPGAPSDYALSSLEAAGLEAVLPRASEPAAATSCGSDNSAKDASARFASWLTPIQPSSSGLWPCTNLQIFQPLSSVDCVERCVTWKPTEESDGSASCLVLVDTLADTCDASIGWLDPMDEKGIRKPVRTQTAQGTLTTCEVQQLKGAALESCKLTPECTDCQPGWCVTDVWKSLETSCSPGKPHPFRFVKGSDTVTGNASIVCNVE